MLMLGRILLVALILLVAAGLEVGGDAIIRRGLQGRSGTRIALGAGLLVLYGVVVNLIPGDFSRLLGSYVAVFAVVAVVIGWSCFGETITPTTWLGLALIVLGGAIIQIGSR